MTISAMERQEDIDYFVEWGGRAWIDLTRRGLDGFLGGRLDGLRALEIGARSGRMSSLLALRGADVLGIDIEAGFVQGAAAEVLRWGVTDRVRLAIDDGRLGAVPDASMDVVFTKSVLVMIPDLETYLPTLATKMRRGGRFVFIENGRGSMTTRAARRLRHPTWDIDRIAYFTQDQIALIARSFAIESLEAISMPPIYLICGRVRESAA